MFLGNTSSGRGGKRPEDTENGATTPSLKETNQQKAENLMRLIESIKSSQQTTKSNTRTGSSAAAYSGVRPTNREGDVPGVVPVDGTRDGNHMGAPKAELMSSCEEALAQLETKFEELVAMAESPERTLLTQSPEWMNQIKADILLLRVEQDKLKEMSAVELCQKQRDNAMLRQEMCELRSENDHLQRAKRKLENVMAVCQQTLEELRQQADQDATTTTGCKTGIKRTREEDSQDWPSVKWTKLKLNDQVMCRTNEYTVGIEIADVDPDGDYLTLRNCTDHRIDLCLWTVTERGQNKVVTVEVLRNLLLLQGRTLTIWSQVAQSQNRGWCPDDDQNWTMADKNWLKLRKMTITVKDGDRQIQAKCRIELFKENSTQYQRRALMYGKPDNAAAEASNRVRRFRNSSARDSTSNVTYNLPPGTVLLEFPTVRLTPLKASQIAGATFPTPDVSGNPNPASENRPSFVVDTTAATGNPATPASATPPMGVSGGLTGSNARPDGQYPWVSRPDGWSSWLSALFGGSDGSERPGDKDSCCVM
ncbi:hypothetical protein Btru_051366 [Bulinus truncatus]|nr:hypothetical protein Btru_051366 [Bulinus truncatus]